MMPTYNSILEAMAIASHTHMEKLASLYDKFYYPMPYETLSIKVKNHLKSAQGEALQALLSSLPDNENKTLEDIGNLRGYYKQLLEMKK